MVVPVLRLILFFTWKLLTIIGIGMDMTRTPEMAHNEPTHLPSTVVGCMSPYPTVVIVITLHQKLLGME